MLEAWYNFITSLDPTQLSVLVCLSLGVLVICSLTSLIVLFMIGVYGSRLEKARNTYDKVNDRLLDQVISMERLVMESNGVVNATQNAIQELKEVRHG